jgi:hypothetical protein
VRIAAINDRKLTNAEFEKPKKVMLSLPLIVATMSPMTIANPNAT